VDAQIGMGEALLNRDEPNYALDYLLSASRLDPASATVHYQLALLYRKLGRGSDSQLG
jgi:Tfp pilus assembly protein PilF